MFLFNVFILFICLKLSMSDVCDQVPKSKILEKILEVGEQLLIGKDTVLCTEHGNEARIAGDKPHILKSHNVCRKG
jgi:hypothetical protein